MGNETLKFSLNSINLAFLQWPDKRQSIRFLIADICMEYSTEKYKILFQQVLVSLLVLADQSQHSDREKFTRQSDEHPDTGRWASATAC